MSKWYINEAMNFVEDKTDAKCVLALDVVHAEITVRTPVDEGNLKGNNQKRKIKKAHYQFFNNTEYAAMREFGGVIKPVNAKALAIPIHKKAKGVSPREFSDLFMIKKPGKDPLLARKKGKGIEIMYVLKKRVYQKAANNGKGFIRPGVDAAKRRVKALGL